jgi:hypothetical protein
VLSPLAAKRHRLNGLDAEGHDQRGDDHVATTTWRRPRGDDHVATPAPLLAAWFRRADSSTAKDQNHGGKGVVVLPTTTVFMPAATAAPVPPPLPVMMASPPQQTTSPCGLVSPLQWPVWPPGHDSELQQLNGSDATAENNGFLTTKRRRLDSNSAEDEVQRTTQCRHLVLRPPRPPLPAQRSHDAECCQLGSSDNGGASNTAGPSSRDVDVAFRGCLRMSPVDGNGDTAEAAFLPKPSPSLQGPSSLLAPLVGPVQCPPMGLLVPPASAELSEGMRASLAALEADSQAARLAHAKREQSDKSTVGTYKRHVNRYEKWWQGYQAEQMNAIPGWTTIPAFPIMAAKVSMFLGYESTREKVSLSLSLHHVAPIH